MDIISIPRVEADIIAWDAECLAVIQLTLNYEEFLL